MLWLALVVGLFAAALSLALVAHAPRMGYTLREPTEAEEERLRRLREDVDAPDLENAIRTTNREGAVECDLLGLPGRRTLVVTDAALEQLDDEQLRALVAVETERAGAWIDELQTLSTGVAVAIVAAAYVTPLPFLEALVGGWLIVLVAIVLVRQRYYAADDAAAALVGREILRDAMERAAELRDDSLETGRIWSALLEVEPSVGARLERLPDRTEQSR